MSLKLFCLIVELLRLRIENIFFFKCKGSQKADHSWNPAILAVVKKN